MSLEGKVALVAGATRGAGRGIALALGETGATVVVTGRSVNAGDHELGGTIGETAAAIDTEVSRILDKAHDRVRQMLTSRRELLEIVAQRLLDREVLDGDELRAIIADAGAAAERPAASAS